MLSIPILAGTIAIIIPNILPERISPKRIALRDKGEQMSLSKVLILVSQGAMTGPIDEEVKKTARLSIPGKREMGEIFLPRAKARKRKKGKNIPKIRTGDFR